MLQNLFNIELQYQHSPLWYIATAISPDIQIPHRGVFIAFEGLICPIGY